MCWSLQKLTLFNLKHIFTQNEIVTRRRLLQSPLVFFYFLVLFQAATASDKPAPL